MKAPALKKGDTIGVISTSCRVDRGDLEDAGAFMERCGYNVYIHPQATEYLHQSAGTADAKAAAFHDLLRNPDIRAIVGSRGGNRALTMLDKIDFSLVAAHPKIVMGYSDMTALLNAIHRKTGLTTIHGPLFRELPGRQDLAQTLDLLGGALPEFDFSGCAVLREGRAEGRLIGGNLSVLQALSGTPYQPDTNGAILFIEDCGDHLSRYDRMLAHMKLVGWFDGIAGLIVGRFTETADNPDNPFGFSLQDILIEHCGDRDIPLVMDAPFGHGGPLCPLPVGGVARLEARHGRTVFRLTEPAVES